MSTPLNFAYIEPDITGIDLEGVRVPTWSPDGQRIVYVRGGFPRVGGASWTLAHLVVMNVDGTDWRPVPSTPSGVDVNSPPAWSPNGKQIAFVARGGSPSDTEVYVVDVDKRRGITTTNVSQYVWRDERFSWSPDGEWIAFQSNRDGPWDIFKAKPDGTHLTRLTNRLNIAPAGVWWSPDGQHIAFVLNPTNPGELPGDLYLTRPDGSDQVQLTTHGRVSGQVAWSPDSTLLAFVSFKEGQTDISVVTRDGSEEYNVTNDAESDSQPAWQPGQVRTAPQRGAPDR